uniref:MYND-type domain-containing protein n=1 Tax=Mycena chlorophos TaxID=658473 RepID=A0ABQ0L8S4_MYCCL|nr:predicted protein [Mycena chlorophos]
MSRAANTKFTPASQGDSIAECAHCRKAPEEGRSFAVCAGCKQMSFCSKQCQKDAWPAHKAFCKQRQAIMDSKANTPSSASFPSFQIRRRLSSDFVEVHECDFTTALYSAVIVGGETMEKFPYTTRGLRIYLRYNPLCNENPSTAFTLHSYAFFDDAAERANPPLGASAGIEAMSAALRARPGFCGFLRVYYQMEDHVLIEPYPMLRKQDVIGNAMEVLQTQLVDHKPWFARIQKSVREGLVKRAARARAIAC